MTGFKALLAFFGIAAGMAVAQVSPIEDTRERNEETQGLTLDAGRAARVQAILDQAREKVRVAREQIGPPTDPATQATLNAAMEAIRSDTDQKLATVLTPEELAQLQAARRPLPRLEAMKFRRG